MQALGQSRRDLLRARANFDLMHVSVLAQAVVDEIDHARGNGEAQAFAASALRKNESVDAENRAVHIDQRASAVAGIDGSIGLQVSERLGGIGLAGECADHAHGDRILQPFGTADGEHELPDMRALAEQRKGRQIGLVNFEQREIGVFMLADESRLENAALPDRHLAGGVAHGQRQRDANALCALNHVRVRHDVAARSRRSLPSPPPSGGR